MRLLNSVLLAVICFTTSIASANPVGGTKYGSGVIASGDRDAYTMLLDSETTIFKIEGDGDGDIDCIVFDEQGRELDRDTRSVDGCRLVVTPFRRMVARFVFVNNGSMASAYQMKAY